MNLNQQILNLFEDDSVELFSQVALAVFRYQANYNTLYKRFLSIIKCDPSKIIEVNEIPLLPISCFKRHIIKTGEWQSEKIFLSSGTMKDGVRSQHHIRSLDWYHMISSSIFKTKMIGASQSEIISLLPSYIENGDSSLVEMVNHLQHNSTTDIPFSFLYEFDNLNNRLLSSLDKGKPVILIGVTFALLDFAEKYHIDNSKLSIIYTGGMKNRRAELEPDEIRYKLKNSFPQSNIYSEYGMTEMQSQAYTDNGGLFSISPSLRILIKEFQDPLTNRSMTKTGQIGIIDLANIDTLSFILTDDLGVKTSENKFQVLGRLSNSDMRGCHLLYDSKRRLIAD